MQTSGRPGRSWESIGWTAFANALGILVGAVLISAFTAGLVALSFATVNGSLDGLPRGLGLFLEFGALIGLSLGIPIALVTSAASLLVGHAAEAKARAIYVVSGAVGSIPGAVFAALFIEASGVPPLAVWIGVPLVSAALLWFVAFPLLVRVHRKTVE